MSTPRTVRVTVDGITTNLRTISGCHYAVGDPALTSVLRVPRLPDGSAWCTVDVHSRPGAEVTAEPAPEATVAAPIADAFGLGGMPGVTVQEEPVVEAPVETEAPVRSTVVFPTDEELAGKNRDQLRAVAASLAEQGVVMVIDGVDGRRTYAALRGKGEVADPLSPPARMLVFCSHVPKLYPYDPGVLTPPGGFC